jgi:hypothetical protein
MWMRWSRGTAAVGERLIKQGFLGRRRFEVVEFTSIERDE